MNNKLKQIADLIEINLLKKEDWINLMDQTTTVTFPNGQIVKRLGYNKFPIQKKWYINKNETIYFWDPNNKTYSSNWGFQYFQQYSDSFKIAYNLSQEEVDQIIKEMKEEQKQQQLDLGSGSASNPFYFGADPAFSSPTGYKPLERKNICAHEWATYTGLNQTDTYCKKCNEIKK